MDRLYSLPEHHDYALTILTQAAMQTNPRLSKLNSDTIASNYSNERHQATNQTFTSAENSRVTPNSTTSVTPSSISNHHNDISQHRIAPSVSNLIGNFSGEQPTDMETLSFNATQQIPQSAYMNQAYTSTYPSSLGILSAEKYDDGRGALRAHEAGMQRVKDQTQSFPFGMLEKSDDNPDTRTTSEENERGTKRKRKPRNEAQSAEDEEEARKKARGRPRVDTKDETAADRRRTQIRMAQRAYRHRKETTISSLEKQVQDLRGTNEEMNNIFINLYDFAISKGLLQREPEFGQQLQSTTQRFLTLARQSASDENSKEDEDLPEEIAQQPHKEPEQAITRRKKSRRSTPEPESAEEPMVSAWGGYTVSKDMSSDDERSSNYIQQNARQRPQDVQVISRATEDNASFPFDMTDIQNYRAEIPSPTLDDFSQFFFPQSQPPLPSSGNYSELTFARRIHRAALERGYRLITSKNPSKKHLQKVFGFTLLYESKEAIAERFRRSLSRSAKESMYEWSEPFVHMGGAGTYYPNQENSDFMPKFRTGLSMGPFSATISSARNHLSGDMRSTFPGFEGEFFDPNDVEGYLRNRGFDVPPAADFITAEVDLVALGGASPSSVSDGGLPITPRSPSVVSNTINILGDRDREFGHGGNIFDFDAMLNGKDGGATKKSNTNTNTSKNGLIPNFMLFPSWEQGTSNGYAKEVNPFEVGAGTLFADAESTTRASLSPVVGAAGEKRLVTISVESLIEEITSRGVCLGRSPGFKPADVNAAIVAAAKQAGF